MPYFPDDLLVVLSFVVQIEGAGPGVEMDAAWETCTGGSLNIEVADRSVGPPQAKLAWGNYLTPAGLPGPEDPECRLLVLTAGDSHAAFAKWLRAVAARNPLPERPVIDEMRLTGPEGKLSAVMREATVLNVEGQAPQAWRPGRGGPPMIVLAPGEIALQ